MRWIDRIERYFWGDDGRWPRESERAGRERRPDGGRPPSGRGSHDDARKVPDGKPLFAYGAAAGRHEVEPEHFRDYLRHTIAGEEVDARLAAVERRERELEARAEWVRERRAEAAGREARAEQLRGRIERADDRLDDIDSELDAAEAERMDVRHSGLFSYVLIFCGAALAFILADIVITRTIVADALALTGRDFMGVDESWYFAFALAFLAVLLKPAYDRLVEARYWDGESGWFIGVIVVASVFAIATLGVLGWFRAVAFEAQTLGELALQRPDAEALVQWEAFRDLQERVVTSGWGKAAFVMSGVLFAVAGAICLGIGLRHFHDFRHVRLPLRSTIRRLRRERKRTRKRRRKAAERLDEVDETMRREVLRLDDSPGLDRILEELREVRDERGRLRERWAELEHASLSSLYSDGYATGRRMNDARPAAPAEPDDGPGPRPYVAVRRRIRARIAEDETPAQDAAA